MQVYLNIRFLIEQAESDTREGVGRLPDAVRNRTVHIKRIKTGQTIIRSDRFAFMFCPETCGAFRLH